jgi:putative membrane protein
VSDAADEDTGREPDYRMSLAAERTYLAYLRTGLAFTAAGVAVAGALPGAGVVGVRRGLGVALVVLGALLFVFARVRLDAVTRAMRNGEPLPAVRFGMAVTIALVAVAVVAGVIVLVV